MIISCNEYIWRPPRCMESIDVRNRLCQRRPWLRHGMYARGPKLTCAVHPSTLHLVTIGQDVMSCFLTLSGQHSCAWIHCSFRSYYIKPTEYILRALPWAGPKLGLTTTAANTIPDSQPGSFKLSVRHHPGQISRAPCRRPYTKSDASVLKPGVDDSGHSGSVHFVPGGKFDLLLQISNLSQVRPLCMFYPATGVKLDLCGQLNYVHLHYGGAKCGRVYPMSIYW
jgi:hypothetical protein